MSSRDCGERPVPLKSEPAHPEIGGMNSAREIVPFLSFPFPFPSLLTWKMQLQMVSQMELAIISPQHVDNTLP